VAKIPAEYVGLRYDEIKDMPFEIQVRTILMDAWANVSHHLDYKGEASVPQELRRDFYALSGLFFVADKHFELFFDQSKTSQETAPERLRTTSEAEVAIDLDTLEAFLQEQLSDRERGSREEISELVEELSALGFSTIEDVRGLLNRHLPVAIAVEEGTDERYEVEAGARFADVAVLRFALIEEVGFEKYEEVESVSRPRPEDPVRPPSE
jgi:hypothetical protein